MSSSPEIAPKNFLSDYVPTTTRRGHQCNSVLSPWVVGSSELCPKAYSFEYLFPQMEDYFRRLWNLEEAEPHWRKWRLVSELHFLQALCFLAPMQCDHIPACPLWQTVSLLRLQAPNTLSSLICFCWVFGYNNVRSN